MIRIPLDVLFTAIANDYADQIKKHMEDRPDDYKSVKDWIVVHPEIVGTYLLNYLASTGFNIDAAAHASRVPKLPES